MEKIGIITYHRAINYGAILQSYALNHFLYSINHTTEIIDYKCDAVDNQYKIKSLRKSSSFKNFLDHNLTCVFHLLKKRRFRLFSKQELIKSISLFKEELKTKTNYDILITGSDQVFNPICNRDDSSFYLDFSKTSRKYSYAASLGSINQFCSSKLNTLSLLNNFDYVSLREQDSVDYLKNKLTTQVIYSVDPVWLLKKEEWFQLFSFSKRNSHYILVYNLMNYKSMQLYSKKLSKEKKIPIISVNGLFQGDLLYFGKSKIASNCSPREFLKLIYYSDYFITDSFHGTCFATIFEKKFVSFLNEKKNNTNSRLKCLLDIMGLMDRAYTNESFNIDDEINYKKAKELIQVQIDKSKKYLKEIVESRI